MACILTCRQPRILVAGATAGLTWALAFCQDASAVTRHVPVDYPTIGAAIAAAVSGDVIAVAPGTYSESLSLAGKAITLRGSGSGTTTITGANLGARVLACNTGETSATVIEGFTIHGGYSPSGAGLFINNASPTVRDCVFFENYADNFGGAVMVAHANSKPRLERCVFRFNSAFGGGGAVQLAAGSAAIVNCTFISNSGPGAGVNVLAGSHHIVNCRFLLNEGGFANGGAVAVAAGGTVVANCMMVANHSFFNGGAIWAGSSSSPKFINCTIVENSATEGSGVYLADTTTAQFANCLLWNNQLGAFAGPVVPNVSHSNVQGGVLAGAGNISSPPLFVNPIGTDNNLAGYEDNDYRLLPNSPGVDRGDSGAIPPDAIDLDGDGDLAEPLPLDFDNHRRVVDAMAVNGGPAQPVDMGAFETRVPCPGDVAPYNEVQFGDDVVDVDDLLAVINTWGQGSVQHTITLNTGAEWVPALLNVKSGDTVRFQFQISSHTATSGSNCTPDGRFDHPSSAGGSFVYPVGNTFVGTVPYFCKIHCGGMQGVMYVKPFPGDVTANAIVNVEDLLAVINHWGECPQQ